MKVNDRGTQKWTAIMLPEHIAALKKLFAETEHKERPILDDQQLMENQRLLQEAIEYDLEITVKYFKDHDFHFVAGKVMYIQTQNRYLQLDDVRIKLDDIIEVNL